MDRKYLEELLTDVSFVRWIRGEASFGEDLQWNAWLQKKPEHQQYVQEAREVISAFQQEENQVPEISGEWQKLERGIDREEKLNVVLQKRTDMHLVRKSKSIMATVLLIAGISLGVLGIYRYQSIEEAGKEDATDVSYTQEYSTDYGEKATFRLNDNSRIVLNANSFIRFSSDVDGGLNSTEVWLRGEAWFDITHLEDDHQRIFTVHTDDGSVRVLGTRFAVKTFENQTRTVLEKGEIQVQVTHQKSGQKNSFILEPGDMAMFSTEKEEISLEKVNPRIYTSWNEDIWFFEDTPLDEVQSRIEDTFGIEVEIQEDLSRKRLSGSIKGTNLDVLAEALGRILDIEIEQQEQTLFIGKNKISQ